MLVRRLVAVLLVAAVACVALPGLAQDKGKDKDKPKDKSAEKAPSGDKVTIQWKFKKGTPFYQKMVTKTSQQMKVMNNDVNQTQNQTFFFKFEPVEVSDDKARIKQTITGVAMDIEIGGSKISYDSKKADSANNPLGEFFKALVGAEFTLDLDLKKMEVTKVEGRDAFINKLVSANPQMKPLLETILSTDALKEMAAPTFAVVPSGPVAKGEKWTRTTKLDMGPIGRYENTYNYVYEGADKGEQKIKVDTVLTYKEPTDASGGQGGLPFRIKSAKLTSKNPLGQISFNSAKGRLDKSVTKLELRGALKIEIGGQETTVDLSQTQESTIDTSDDDPLKGAK